MTISASLLPEFDQETKNTRAVLERVPEDQAGWKPHPKSYSLGELALHLANLPTWGALTLEQTSFDLSSGSGAQTRSFTTTQDLLATFDANSAAARAALAAASDADLMVGWTLLNKGTPVFSLPRVAVFRSFVMNHAIHHRGQLTVYLRLRDVPLPSIYGPTADGG